MGTIWIKEFVGGLDTRRMPETTSGGVLIKAVDGHITRGGEFQKRAAFVPVYTLPDGRTVDLAAGKNSLFVFGHDAPPTLPAGVEYQRLQHPDGVTALIAVPSYDLYGGKIYAVGEFADGSRYHFYDGVRIPDWFDGRARASFRVTAGSTTAATSAVGSFEVTGGTLSAGVNRFTNITIDGVAIISGAVDHTGNNSTTASAIATAINSFSSSPDYSASASGQTVTITAVATGPAANGKTIVVSVGGNATAGNIVNMAGGANAATSSLDSLKVDGVEILSAPVTWATSNSNTAALIAASVNAAISTPDYSATAVNETVNIVAASAGSSANNRVVAFTLSSGLAVTPSTGLVLAGGSDPTPAAAAVGSFDITGGTNNVANQITDIKINGVSIISGAVTHTGTNSTTATAVAAAINSFSSTPDYTASADGVKVTVTAANTGTDVNGQSIVVTTTGNFTVGNSQAMSGGAVSEATYVPGTFVKTIGSRVHSVSGSNEHFSGIKQPTKWTTDTTGAGFIDMSTQESGSENLTALARYQKWVAVFAERVIQIWYFDSDPSLNAQSQVLNNTGTSCPLSVTQFGDSDLFYCSESGLRSLRARDASNAASTTDVGVPVDPLIVEQLRTLSDEQRKRVVGVIEPGEGRFWLSMLNKIFVFSFFSGAKVSAWTTYEPSYFTGDNKVTFEAQNLVTFRRKVFVRSGNTIYVYGGLGSALEYDKTEAEMWLPYLDAERPTAKKQTTGFDAACEGRWEVRAAMDPTDLDASDKIGVVSGTTYVGNAIETVGAFTHLSLRFKSQGEGAARVGAAVIHYADGSPD